MKRRTNRIFANTVSILLTAWEVFQNALISRIDSREDYGEDRWHGIGVLQGRTVVIVFAERDPDIVRIISLRKANKNEKKQYEKAITEPIGLALTQ